MVISLAPDLSNETLVKLFLHYKEEKINEEDRLRRNPLFDEAKLFVRLNKNELLRNAHLSKLAIESKE